ncbi:MAG: hypothetical protein NC517_04500 [Firmicutes bacterium]|nr:hypothetical protein [Bacillota bacterium]
MQEGHSQIPDWFEAIDVKIVSNELVDVLKSFCVATGAWEFKNLLYGHFHRDSNGGLLPEFFQHNLSDFPARYREFVFRLPQDCELEEPKIVPQRELFEALIEKYSIGEHTVILMPYAYSMGLLSDAFWEEAADLLTDMGYTVYTNVKDDSEFPIAGTTAICADIATMAALCERCRMVIALRSGICDVLYFTETRLITINGQDLISQWNAEKSNRKRHIYNFQVKE